jgi:hypothetical protein
LPLGFQQRQGFRAHSWRAVLRGRGECLVAHSEGRRDWGHGVSHLHETFIFIPRKTSPAESQNIQNRLKCKGFFPADESNLLSARSRLTALVAIDGTDRGAV